MNPAQQNHMVRQGYDRLSRKDGRCGMIGLRRHAVRLADYDSTWPAAGEAECRSLRELGAGLVLDAQHVGSTAVPGLPAKPILDIAVLIETAGTVPRLIQRLASGGYIYRGDHGASGGHLVVRESEPDVRVAHVHVFVQGDQQWDDCLIFRDALRKEAGLRERYAQLKQDLVRKHAGDRPSYTRAKEAFIQSVLRSRA